MASDTP